MYMYMDSVLPAVPGLLIKNLLIFGACLLLRMDVNNYTSSTDFFVHVYTNVPTYTTSKSFHLAGYKAHCIHTQHNYM